MSIGSDSAAERRGKAGQERDLNPKAKMAETRDRAAPQRKQGARETVKGKVHQPFPDDKSQKQKPGNGGRSNQLRISRVL